MLDNRYDPRDFLVGLSLSKDYFGATTPFPAVGIDPSKSEIDYPPSIFTHAA